MKNLKYFSLIFLIFLLFPFKTSAASFVISPESLSGISEGLQDLTVGAYHSFGLSPVNVDKATFALSNITKKDFRTSVSMSDFDVITDLSEMPYEYIDVMSNWEYCDSDGTIFNNEGLKYGHFDNGYYSGECIFDSDGNLVYRYIEGSVGHRMCQFEFGGSELNKSAISNAYHNITDIAKLNGFVYSEDSTVNGFNTMYYMWTGGRDRWGNGVTQHMYILNQYQPGLIIPATTGGYINSWYTNDLSLMDYTNDFGETTVSSGNYSYGGYSYSYRVTFQNGMNFSGSVSSYEQWVNSPWNGACFSNVGCIYDGSLVNEDTAGFIPVTTELNPSQMISISDPYGLDNILSGGIAGVLPVRNVEYVQDEGTDEDNYPVVIPIDIPIGGVLPFPDEDEEEEEGETEITYPFPDDILIPEGGFDFPILNNLKNKFPFSIPWDIKNMLKSLRANPKAPKFDIVWNVPRINYTWNFSIDLSMFDRQAEIFRTCFLISFIIGLALFSYKHFFGS